MSRSLSYRTTFVFSLVSVCAGESLSILYECAWGDFVYMCVCWGEFVYVCVCVKAISAVLCGLDGVLQGGPRSAHRRKGDIREEGVQKKSAECREKGWLFKENENKGERG